MKLHTRNEKFVCSVCGCSFGLESVYHTHLTRIHNMKWAFHKCTFCSSELPSKQEWAIHELRHAGWKCYKCARCGRELVNASAFQRHRTGKDTMSTCPGETDLSGEDLKKYRKQCMKDWESAHAEIIGNKKSLDEIAPKKPVFTCSFCQQAFTRKSKWAVHELRHTGWKEYKCVKCGKECADNGTFLAHAYNKFKSDKCMGNQGLTGAEIKVYRRESKKDWQSEHTRVLAGLTSFNENDFKHLNPIPKFKCTFCSKIFTRRSEFAVHELRHTGWNQFKCIKCGKECSNASTFHDHVYQKKGNKTCSGGVGLTTAELDNYRKQCAKDWAAEHATNVGALTQREKDEISKKILTQAQRRTTRCEKPKANGSQRPINKLAKPVYVCRFCALKFATKFTWACHELEHTGWKHYQCTKCGREFGRNCKSTFTEHIHCKRKKQKCPGGKGLNAEEFEAYRTECRKDWQAEHAQIIGKQTHFAKVDQNLQNGNHINNRSLPKLETTYMAEMHECRSLQKNFKMKNCSVALTRLKIITIMPDSVVCG